ncbi:MAG: hypothetical protein U1F46_08220 [Marinagarivorans sp.]
MGNKIILAGLLLALSGCGSDKSKQDGYSCFLGSPVPQVEVNVTNALGGPAIKNAKVKVIQIGKSSSGSFDAVYVDNASGQGSYISTGHINEREYQINISVSAEGFQNYQSKNVAFSQPVCGGGDTTTYFTVNLCPTGATCQ